MSIASQIYIAAGSPPMVTTTTGVCRVCGVEGEGVPFAAWVKPTFTDHDKLRPGTMVCQACQFCSSEDTPGLAERVGKDKPQKFRNYSHFVVDGTWYPLSKGQKPQMRDLLQRSPTVALIALSGQKHLFFRATPGWWQIEETASRPFPKRLRMLLDLVTPMLTVFSKAEIETGRYDQRRILMYGLPAWKEAEDVLCNARYGLPLLLALFLAQKEEPTNDE